MPQSGRWGSLPPPGRLPRPRSGSGTTIIAAEMTGRVCHAIEIAPAYVDVAVKRWQAFTGLEAELDGDGRSFEEIALERAAQDRRPEPASRVDDADHTVMRCKKRGACRDWHPVGPASKLGLGALRRHQAVRKP